MYVYLSEANITVEEEALYFLDKILFIKKEDGCTLSPGSIFVSAAV